MKVKFTVQKGQETESGGMFSKDKQKDLYIFTSTFYPTEMEKKIYNDHPLFKSLIFMKYHTLGGFYTGRTASILEGREISTLKVLRAEDIYNSPTLNLKVSSISNLIDLRELITEAGQLFANNVKVLDQL